jgi:hypothetical protein
MCGTKEPDVTHMKISPNGINETDCTECRNTQVLFYLTEILWDHKFLSENSGVGLHKFHSIVSYIRILFFFPLRDKGNK